MTSIRRNLKIAARVVFSLATVLATNVTRAQVVAPAYAGSYSVVNLGAVSGLPGSYGGLTFKAGDVNTLLVGGNANASTGGIYSIGVTRGIGGHITGFTGSASLFATAPDIDGGLAYGPGGVLFYTSWSDDTVGEIKPGGLSASKIVGLSALGVTNSPGGLQIQPGGSALKVISFSGATFYSLALTADGGGTYNLGPASATTTALSGPEGFVYPSQASPLFSARSLLISEWSGARISSMLVDVNGNPLSNSRQDFVTSFGAAEGATFDPVTGDALFSSFSGRVIEVRGFATVPEPSTILTAVIGLCGLLVMLSRRKKERYSTRPTTLALGALQRATQ